MQGRPAVQIMPLLCISPQIHTCLKIDDVVTVLR